MAEDHALARLHALAMADAAVRSALGDIVDLDQFAATAVATAATHGISITPDAIASSVRPDPLGMARWTSGLTSGAVWPPAHWLPIQVVPAANGLQIDWAYFGNRRLIEPFFEDSIRHALRTPLARMVRYRTSLHDFIGRADAEFSLKPSGFIFHMSRCGSTLVAQMLAALPENIVISEAAPIDTIVQLGRAVPGAANDQQAKALATMVAAFGRRRGGGERRYFIKLDSWHTLSLPLFRRAFPNVPWVFLYRDPIEVLVSQMRQSGTQMVPEFMHPSLYGIESYDPTQTEDYYARVLRAVCQAVLDDFGEGGGLVVNYRDLPEALFTQILPHFGVAFDAREGETMRAVASQDAKAPGSQFTGDSDSKQREATPAIHAAAGRHLDGVYRALEALRTRATP